MATIHHINEVQISRFALEEWQKTLVFLQKHYGLLEEDCQDIFQEAFIVLYEKIKTETLQLSSSLSAYFLGICKNKAQECIRNKKKWDYVEDELPFSLLESDIQLDKIEAVIALEENTSFETQKEDLVDRIIQELSSPCKELLWGFYRDNLSLKTLAELLHYSSENSVKVTKHRCCEKLRVRYNELCKNFIKAV